MARKRTNYSRGVETERKIIHLLREKGYVSPVRTAGSHGLFDIIANNKEHVLFIQAKRSKTDISFTRLYKEDLIEILEIIDQFPKDVQIETWVWVDRKGWKERLIIKPAGVKYSFIDSTRLVEKVQDGLNPFESRPEG